MAPESLVVAGDDGDVAEVLAGPQRVHVLQGGVPVPRQPETQRLHLVCTQGGRLGLTLKRSQIPALPPGVMLIGHYELFQNRPICDVKSGRICPHQ